MKEFKELTENLTEDVHQFKDEAKRKASSVRRRIEKVVEFPTFSEWIQGTKGQKTRDWFRVKLFSQPNYQVFVAILFTFLHDLAGLFSASPAIIDGIHFLDNTWERVMVIYLPIVVFDCGSELLLVVYHDLPLCRDEFNGRVPSKKTSRMLHIALVGQILTSLCWFGLLVFVAYNGLINTCVSFNQLTQCKGLTSVLTESIIILMVFVKNSMTLKEYNERLFVYPIICSEEVMFTSYLCDRLPHRILQSFEKYHGLEAPDSTLGFFTSSEFNTVFNYIFLIGMDIASLASVVNIILVHNASNFEMALRALPFLVLLIVDVTSESLILHYHDMPLLRGEYEHPKKNKKIFDTSRTMQVMVNIAWLLTMAYMIYLVITHHCEAECNCNEECPYDFDPFTCTPHNGTFHKCFLNGTETWEMVNNVTSLVPLAFPFSPSPNVSYTCNVTWSVSACERTYPTYTSCILLGLVLLDSLYQLGQMFFKSYIYPITVPEYVMFLAYWDWEREINKMKPSQLSKKKLKKNRIILAIGKNEFGPEWKYGMRFLTVAESKRISSQLGEPLLERGEGEVPLESDSGSTTSEGVDGGGGGGGEGVGAGAGAGEGTGDDGNVKLDS